MEADGCCEGVEGVREPRVELLRGGGERGRRDMVSQTVTKQGRFHAIMSIDS